MNDDEHPDDSTLTRELRDALSEVAVPGRPPLAAITSRGRAHQRRLAGFAGLAVAGVAAGTALALGLTGVLGAAPTGSTGTIRTAAFTLTRNANGTDTLALSNSQMPDPAAVQRALEQHGIPALVKTGIICSSWPPPPSTGVLSIQLPDGTPVPGPSSHRRRIPANAVFVINPAAMPTGTELFFGYFNSGRVHALYPGLIYTNSHTCS
jgi:hypothetical protein